MLIVSIAFVAWSLHSADLAGRTFGPIGIGSTRNDVRYMLGAPQAVPGGAPGGAAERWQYRLPEGGTLVADFDPADATIGRLSCEDAAMTPASCPSVLGIRLGDSEMDVWYRLGEPTRQQFAGEAKSLVYDDLGITFQLTRFAVYKVVLNRRPSRLSFLPRMIRYMVP